MPITLRPQQIWSMLALCGMLCQCGLFAFAQSTTVQLDSAAKFKRPSEALRYYQERVRKINELLYKELKEPQLNQMQEAANERRGEQLRQAARQLAQQFNPSDWRTEEIAALVNLASAGEHYQLQAEALRQWLKEFPANNKTRNLLGFPDPRQWQAPLLRIQLVQALIDSDQLAAAVTELDFFKQPPDKGHPAEIIINRLASLANVHLELVAAYRLRGSAELAADYALQGFGTLETALADQRLAKVVNESLRRDQLTLAAQAQAALEFTKDKLRLAELQVQLTRSGLLKETTNKLHFDEALAFAQLIGKPAPELIANHWFLSAPANPLPSLVGVRGKVVLLDFWAMWSAPCLLAFPYYRDWQQRYAAKGLSIFGVTRLFGRSNLRDDLKRDEEYAALKTYLQAQQITWPVAVNKLDDIINEERYGVIGPPTTVLVDRRGTIRLIKRGSGEYRKLAKHIELLLAEQL